MARPGDRLPTESELRDRFGVSIPKLREALTLLDQEGTIERRHGSGTYVADPLKTKHVALFSNCDLTHPELGPFFRTMAYHARRHLHDLGIPVQLYLGRNGPDSDCQAINCPELSTAIQEHRLSGILALTSPAGYGSSQKYFAACPVPIVGTHEEFAYAYTIPRKAMLSVAVHELIRAGRQRIAFVGWQPANDPLQPLAEILVAEDELLRHHQVTILSDWIRMGLYPTHPGAGWEEWREIWLSHQTKPDGLVITDDCLLPDIALALNQLGIRVPADLSIVAFTNRLISPSIPFPCTRLEIDPEALGHEMGDLLLAVIKREQATPFRRDASFRTWRQPLPTAPLEHQQT